MTNNQLTDLRTLILSEVGNFFAVVGSPGEPETPEEMQRELSMRLGRILNNHIVNYPRCEALVEILRECRIARDEAQAELQERRNAEKDSETVYQCEFCHADASGELQWHWEDVNKDFYEQYDSERRGQRRILYSAPQPAPEMAAIVERLNASGYEYEDGEVTPQNAAAVVDILLQQLDDAVQRQNTQPAPVVESEFIPKNLDKALGVIGMAIPESREEFNFQAERWIQRLIDRVIRYADEFKEQPAPLTTSEEHRQLRDLVMMVKMLCRTIRKYNPESQQAADYTAYLQKEGLISAADCLRGSDPKETDTEDRRG